MTETMTYEGTLVIEVCCARDCQAVFAMTDHFQHARRRDHRDFYCPRGHAQHYVGESDLEKERRLRKQAQDREERAWVAQRAASDQAAAAARSNAALRGVITRARNKIAAGVCPVGNCRRPFSNVREHIQHQHPSWHLTDPETGKEVQL